MRIAILWIELTGYLNACFRELASRDGVELFVAHRASGPDYPFSSKQFDWISRRFVWHTASDLAALGPKLEEFHPDVLVIAGWSEPGYRKVARAWKSRALRVMTMDNCWFGSLSQYIGCLTSDFYVRTLTDAMWIPGERQATFARKLHFRQSQILRGHLSCDYAAFSAVHENRLKQREPLRRAFIFVGRMVSEKNLPMMAAAYRLYRKRVRDPWPLVCYGKGPMAEALAAQHGILVEGFVQPEDLPAKFADAGCLVLPSSREAWALVVHEAAAAGLLVLASEAVGAVPHLVQNDYNGFVFGVDDPEGLSELMVRVSLMDDARLNAMSDASASLARQFTPRRWADTLLDYARTSLPTSKDSTKLTAVGSAF
jgi:glycosyltransferase involved in cell wall biosynthesis